MIHQLKRNCMINRLIVQDVLHLWLSLTGYSQIISQYRFASTFKSQDLYNMSSQQELCHLLIFMPFGLISVKIWVTVFTLLYCLLLSTIFDRNAFWQTGSHITHCFFALWLTGELMDAKKTLVPHWVSMEINSQRYYLEASDFGKKDLIYQSEAGTVFLRKWAFLPVQDQRHHYTISEEILLPWLSSHSLLTWFSGSADSGHHIHHQLFFVNWHNSLFFQTCFCHLAV